MSMMHSSNLASWWANTTSAIPRAKLRRPLHSSHHLGLLKKPYKTLWSTWRSNIDGFKVSAMTVHRVKLIGPDGEEHEFEASDESSILESAENDGLELPYSCRSGTCGTCGGQIVSGSVDQSQGSFLDEDQIQNGYVLTCIAHPQSDCIIYTHKQNDLD